LYASDDDVRGHDQTIIFSTHDSIGIWASLFRARRQQQAAPQVRQCHRADQSAAGRHLSRQR
jgi:hypothetical protein